MGWAPPLWCRAQDAEICIGTERPGEPDHEQPPRPPLSLLLALQVLGEVWHLPCALRGSHTLLRVPSLCHEGLWGGSFGCPTSGGFPVPSLSHLPQAGFPPEGGNASRAARRAFGRGQLHILPPPEGSERAGSY